VEAVSVFRLEAGAHGGHAARIEPSHMPEAPTRPLASSRKKEAIASTPPLALARGTAGDWTEF
jgi:methyl-accepting chemotaxis protein